MYPAPFGQKAFHVGTMPGMQADVAGLPLRELVNESRRRVIADPDSICLDRARLVTEAWKQHESDPVPLRRAKALAHILQGMTLDLETNPVFAGNVTSRPRAWLIMPEYGIGYAYHLPTENPNLGNLLDGDAVPADIREYWKGRSAGGIAGVGHFTVRYDLVIQHGLEHFIALAEADHGPSTPEQRICRQACRVTCQAVIDWANRYAREAETLAVREADPVRASALRRVATACSHVPAKPARNVFEALQAIVLIQAAIHLEGHAISVSPGLVDRWLAPFANDIADDESLTQLCEAFLLKFSQIAQYGRHINGQPITLGGTDAEGRDQCNRITLALLEAGRRVKMPDPYLFLRWHDGMDQRVKTLACEMLAEGVSFPLLSGDAETRAGLEHAGITPADAAEYVLIGCNELGIPGKLMSMYSAGTEEIEILREVLVAPGAAERITGMDALVHEMKIALKPRLMQALRDSAGLLRHSSEKTPTPFTSALMDGCIERGRDFHVGMVYDRLNLYVQGFTNVINGLAAVDQVVFRDRTATVTELAEALRTDYAGAESLRAKLLAAPKWGNDDNRADRWATLWLQARDEAAEAAYREVGCEPPLYCHVVRSMHISRGRRTKATPDGRRDGDLLSDSIGAPIGTPRHGTTALLNSVCKLNARRHWPGGYNLNIAIPPAVKSDRSLAKNVAILADTFFAHGGQELQVNAFTPEMLRDAKAHPGRYPDLVVRIAGYTAHFDQLTRQQKDELIARAEDAR